MREELIFGDGWITADLPDDTVPIPPGISLPLEPAADLDRAYTEAVERPLDTPPLTELVRPGSRITVAFDDSTVPCYAPAWRAALPAILGALARGGVAEDDITLLCANALHRKFTHQELAGILGENVVGRFRDRLLCHDAEDPSGTVHLGDTPAGYPVEVNRLVVDSDLTVYLNCSTTRGFSGGWKSVCVGLSTYRSIRTHHDPDTMSMSLHRNRTHDILDEMGRVVEDHLGEKRIFKVETVLANPLQVHAALGWFGGCHPGPCDGADAGPSAASTEPRRRTGRRGAVRRARLEPVRGVLEPAASVEALDMAREKHGEGMRVALVRYPPADSRR